MLTFLFLLLTLHSVHCGSIRQTATILSMNRDCLRTGDKASVHFRFIKTPEYLHCDQRLVFREGRTKAVGTITKVKQCEGTYLNIFFLLYNDGMNNLISSLGDGIRLKYIDFFSSQILLLDFFKDDNKHQHITFTHRLFLKQSSSLLYPLSLFSAAAIYQ